MEFVNIPPRIKANEHPDQSLGSHVQFLPSGERLVTLLNSTAAFLKAWTNSDGYIHYSLDEAVGELYICPVGSTNRGCITRRYKWSLARTDTIAVYVFKNKIPILVDANTSLDLNFPYLQGLPTLAPRYILSLPLVNLQKRCFGVVELYRNFGRQYHEMYNGIQTKLQAHLEMYTLGDGNNESYTFLYNVVGMAREYTRSMTSSLYFEKNNKIEKIISTDDYTQPLGMDQNLSTGLIMQSVAKVDFHTTLMERNVHGIIEVTNKIGRSHFSILDGQILEAFAKMCTIWCTIEYVSGYSRKQKCLNDNILGLIKIQLKNAEDFNKILDVLNPSVKKELDSWNYYHDASVGQKKLSSDVVQMITNVKGVLAISDKALRDFVVMVEQCHLSKEDDDFRQTVLCVHGLYRLVAGCTNIFTDYEAVALLISSLCHNIAITHAPKAKSSIFGRYNLYGYELVRFEVVQFLIEQTQLFSLLNAESQSEILRMIKEFLIDSNIECHKQNLLRFTELVQDKDAKQLILEGDPEVRTLIRSLVSGTGNLLGYFKSKKFCENFPNFTLLKHLEEHDLKCVDVLLGINPRGTFS